MTTGTDYTLDINIEGNGSVAINPDQELYAAWTVVELTATPDSGWSFSSWSGDVSSSENPLRVSINTNKTIIVVFSEDAP